MNAKMIKSILLFLCFFTFNLIVFAQPYDYDAGFSDCKRTTSYQIDNNHTWRRTDVRTGRPYTLTGAWADVGFIKCSTNTDVGNKVEICINSDPLKECPRTGCNFTHELPSPGQLEGLGVGFFDCNGDLKIGTIVCNSCPPPTPTPTPTPTPPPPPPGCDAPVIPGYCPQGTILTGDGYCCPYVEDFCQEFEQECYQNGGVWKGCNNGCYSPIVIDVLGNGYNLTNGQNGIEFDLTGEGSKDKVSWTSADSDDAWLVLDRNENGMIDSGMELFGNFTLQAFSISVKDRNGFLALAIFDKPDKGGNGDGAIDYRDAVFNDLRLWQDKNHNGISETNELHILSLLDVATLELDYRESKRTDDHGNRFKYRAKVWDSNKAKVGRWAWDVFLLKGN